MDTGILVPWNKLPALNTVTVMISGIEGVGKHALANAIVGTDTTYSLQVRTATSLPGSSTESKERPRIDFIVFLICLNNKASYTAIEEAVKKVDVQYFLGKSCIAVSQAPSISDVCVEIATVTTLADSHGIPILSCNFEDESQKKSIAKQILTMTEISAGLRNNVSSLLIDSSKYAAGFQFL